MNKMMPSELIHADENGNTVIGKNLEVKGTTKLNGGLKAIHNYTMHDVNTSRNYQFSVLFESPLDDDDHYSAFGYIENANLIIYPCMAWYSLSNNSIVDFKAICINKICEFRNNAWQETLIATQNV